MSKEKLAEVFHFNLYGKREDKYNFLEENSMESIEWKKLDLDEPNYFFVEKDFDSNNEYLDFISIKELFIKSSAGIQTKRDSLFIDDDIKVLEERIMKLLDGTFDDNYKTKFNVNDSSSYKLIDKIQQSIFNKAKIREIHYRPFDNKKIYYDQNLIGRAFYNTMSHLNESLNIGLVVSKQFNDEFKYVMVSNRICDMNLISNAGSFGAGFSFPLYLYPEKNTQLSIGESQNRVPNLNMEIVNKIAAGLGMRFVAEKTSPTPPKEGLSSKDDLHSADLEESFYLSSPKEGLPSKNDLHGVGLGGSTPSVELSQPGYITANPLSYKLIKEMRDSLKDNPTEAEKVMWEYLRNSKTGHKIRRQHIIDDFITDFVCLRKKTVIEIDGKIHLQQKEYDDLRTERLNVLGFKVIRFTNEEVFANPALVTLKIKERLDTISPPSEGLGEVYNESQAPFPSEGLGEVFAPIDILDYIYAVLHSPAYREKYKEFLKIDFPRVPYPTNIRTFLDLVDLGSQLRKLHLLESPQVENYITQYPIDGDNVVIKPHFHSPPLEGLGEVGKVYITQYPVDGDNVVVKPHFHTPPLEGLGEVGKVYITQYPIDGDNVVIKPHFHSPPLEGLGEVGKVYINNTQYFANVPLTAWEFYIGGYQPAQKWLKDRKGRELNFEDILHYQKMIVALKRTSELMVEIDGVLEER